MTSTEKFLIANLSKFFPNSKWEIDKEGVPENVLMYRLIGTDLRIAVFVGMIPGTDKMCGYYFLCRAFDDSENTEASVPPNDQVIKMTINVLVDMCKDKKTLA